MTNWKKYKLDEMVSIIKDGYSPSTEEHLNYIGLEHIEQQSLRLCGIGKSSDVTSTKFKFEAGDILFGKLRPYFRKVYRPKFSGICSTDIWVARAKKNFDQGFIFYLMASEDFINLASQSSSGTRMPRADWNNLKNLEWHLPDLPTQTCIASILSSLDDKIELNRRMNATLEQMAASLFKKYFVEDIDPDNLPEGWRWGKVQDLFILQRGFDLPRTERTHGQYPVFAASGFNGFHDKFMVRGPGVTTGRSGVIGNVFFITEDFWPLNTSLYIREFKISTPLYSFFVLKTINLHGMNGGSAVPTLNRNHVHDLEIEIPPKKLIEEFEAQAITLFTTIRKNEIQIETLSNLRDTLLPKLMSGEIDLTSINQNEPLHEAVLS